MLLLEHEGKALLRRYGIATPTGVVIEDSGSLSKLDLDDGHQRVLKAQVPTGRRGKNGGIVFATGTDQIGRAYEALKSRSINGHLPSAVLLENCVTFDHERYAGIHIDCGAIRLLFARSGGIEIEELTANDESNLISIEVDLAEGPNCDHLKAAFNRLGYADEHHASYTRLAQQLFAMSRECDATTVEINPLIERPGSLLALDARIIIDDHALERQPYLARQSQGPEVSGNGTFLRFRDNPNGGSIAVLGLGGGLNVTLMDWISAAGGEVATLLDVDEAIGIGRGREVFSAALQALDQRHSIRAILINIITCGYRLDDITKDLLAALEDASQSVAARVVLHLRGNEGERTPQMLSTAGWSNCSSLRAAVLETIATAKD